MTLLGLGVLMKQQTDIATRYLGDQLQVTVYLCRDGDANPACAGEVTDDQKQRVEEAIKGSPEVASYRFESQDEAFDKVKELYGADQFDGPNPALTAADMPQSYWITLKDPKKFQGITSEVEGLDGVSQIRDLRSDPQTDLRVARRAEVRLVGDRRVPAGRGAAAGRQHDPARGVRAPQGDRHHAAGRRLHALHRAARSCWRPSSPQRSASRWPAGRSARSCGSASTSGSPTRSSSCRGSACRSTRPSLIVIAVLGPVLTLLPTLLLTRKYLKV